MPIDVHDFSIPESDFSGLHRAAATNERRTERQDLLKQRQLAQKQANATFLLNYLDPKDHLTGTNYDPQIVSGFSDLLAEGSKLATEGADSNMIMMALSPKVSKLSQYAETAKGINARIKSQLSQIPDKAGYDKSKLDVLARKNAFYNPDGSMKDIATIDPNNDYITEAIHNHPDEVTNDAAIDEFVKNSPKFTNTQRVKRTNAKGGYELKKSKVTAPSWATVDDNGEIVPKYDVATNEGEPHTHDFGGGKTAPIRMMNEKDFDSLMGSNPGIADWVKGQVMKADRNVNLNTPQAKNAARAIMYDELKRRGGGGIEDIEEIKANPAPKITVNVKNGADTNIRDIYKEIQDKGTGHTNGAIPLVDLSTGAQSIVLKQARDLSDKELTQKDIYVVTYPDGRAVIKKTSTEGKVKKNPDEDETIGEVDFASANLPAQTSVKPKQKVVEIANEHKPKNSKDPLGLF